MKYNIPAIATADLNVAESAMIGAEVTVLASMEEFESVGNVSLPAAASGVLNLDPTYADPGPGGGIDMVIIADDGILSTTQIIVTLAVILDDGSEDGVAGQAVATFGTPTAAGPQGGWAANQTFDLPKGMATDLLVQGEHASLQIRTITGIVSVTGGATLSQFDIWGLPDDWFDISCAMQKDPTLPVSKSHPIRCGYNPSRFVKKIPGDPGKLSLTTKRRSYGDGLERLNGHRISIMLLVQKDGYLVVERQVYGGLRFAGSPKFPDADAEAEVAAESFFETFAVFV